MSATTTPGQPVARAFALVAALQGRSWDGVRLSVLAKGLGHTPQKTLRDLQVLESLGIAERIPGRDDHWRLTPRLVQIAIAHQAELSRLQVGLDEFSQRYSRTP